MANKKRISKEADVAGNTVKTVKRIGNGNVKKEVVTFADRSGKQVDKYTRSGQLKSSVTKGPEGRNRLSKEGVAAANWRAHTEKYPEDSTLGEDMDKKKKAGATMRKGGTTKKKTVYASGGSTPKKKSTKGGNSFVNPGMSKNKKK
jgi:hypothetical protein